MVTASKFPCPHSTRPGRHGQTYRCEVCASYKSFQILIQHSIKNLSRGSKVYLPVHVAGAKFSVGDLHFSQGDGEISFVSIVLTRSRACTSLMAVTDPKWSTVRCH